MNASLRKLYDDAMARGGLREFIEKRAPDSLTQGGELLMSEIAGAWGVRVGEFHRERAALIAEAAGRGDLAALIRDTNYKG